METLKIRCKGEDISYFLMSELIISRFYFVGEYEKKLCCSIVDKNGNNFTRKDVIDYRVIDSNFIEGEYNE